MKNIFLKSICVATLGILMLVTCAQVSVRAQDNKAEEEKTSQSLRDPETPSNDMEGSWSSLVTLRDCQTGAALGTFPALQTYMRGGTLQDAGADFHRGPGHGVWSYESGRQYSAAFQAFNFAPDGSFAGTIKVRLQNTLSRFSSTFTSTARIEIYNPAGNLVATGCATATSTRFE